MSRKKGSYVVVPGQGDPCPRCGRATEIREHPEIGERQLRQPFYYKRWYNCRNDNCRTTLIMPERFKVWNPPAGAVTEPEPAYPDRPVLWTETGEAEVTTAGPLPWDV
jgi:hypothetical protein